MNNINKYTPIIAFLVLICATIAFLVQWIVPQFEEIRNLEDEVQQKQQTLSKLERDKAIVESKIKRMQDSIKNSPKKLYYPIESDLGDDTLFFTLYNDLIEMLHANSVKIQSIDYEYNPEKDVFVAAGKDKYFVCDVNMELVSNYVNLGKFIQDVYQYPYYIKINSIDIKPYPKDKKILFSKISIRLYAHTSPDESLLIESESSDKNVLNGAQKPLPQ